MVLAEGLNGDLLNDSLELGGRDLNLLNLGLDGLVGDGGGIGVGVGQGVAVGIGASNNWGSISVGVVVGSEGKSWGSWGSLFNLGLLGGGSLLGSGSSLFGSGSSLLSSGGGFLSSGSSFLSSGSSFLSSGRCFGGGSGLFFGLPLGLGARDGDAEDVGAAGVDKLGLVGLDLDLVLLGDELLDDGLVSVDLEPRL
jgi:hypothetical protein